MNVRSVGVSVALMLLLSAAAVTGATMFRGGVPGVAVQSGVETDTPAAAPPGGGASCTLVAPIREEFIEDIDDPTHEHGDNALVAEHPEAAIALWAESIREGRAENARSSPTVIAADRASRARAIPWEKLPAEARATLEQHPFRDRFEVWSTAADLDRPEVGDASYLFVDDGSDSKLLSLEIAVACDGEDVFPQ